MPIGAGGLNFALLVEDIRYPAKLNCHKITINKNVVFGQARIAFAIVDCRFIIGTGSCGWIGRLFFRRP
jgi:hypothetical protein